VTFAEWPTEWGVADAALLSDGIGGRVWRATLAGGGTAIVKQLSPLAIRDRADGEAYLRWRNGAGAVRLLDRRGPLLLMEDAAGPSLLDIFHAHGDDAATEIAAWVIRGVHAPAGAPAPPGLITLRGNFSSLFAKARTETDRTQFVKAAELAERLLSAQRDERPLHGDFHHENVLLSPRGWLVIDPKGVVGDPGFEAANWFYNPLGSDLRYRPQRALEVAAALSPALDRPPETLLDWAFAHAALSASWHLEDGNLAEAEESLRVGRAIADAARQIRS
jgi:streptomycin 6-kinase